MNDLKYAFRQLLKNPGFSVVAILALAIGIAVNTATFTAYNAVALRPIQATKPDSANRGCATKSDLLPDGALARPELPRRGLADDGHRRPSASFWIGKGAPFHNRDTQGIEVIRRHVAVIHRGSSVLR